jgi:magnesium-transporting ATPase (P-type)
MLWRIGFVGALLVFGAGSLFLMRQDRPGTSLEFARPIAVNALVMGQIFYLLNVRFFYRAPFTWEGLTRSRPVIIAIAPCLGLQLLLTYAPFMNLLFGTEPLDAAAWAWCFAVGVGVFVKVELEKLYHRMRESRTTEEAGDYLDGWRG